MDKGMISVLAVALVALLTGVFGAAPAVNVDPRLQTVRVGDDLKIICFTRADIMYCRMEFESTDNKTKTWNLSPKTKDPVVEYSGAGLDVGQCGILIRNVQEQFNGRFRCTIGFENLSDESKGVADVIVAHSPQEPELVVQPEKGQFEFSEGYLLRATCTIRNGRPVANMSWYLDDRPLEISTASETMKDKELYTIIQNYSRTLSYEDNGKKLICMAQHLALDRSFQNSFAINVRFAPRTKFNPIELFGFEVDQPAEISVEVQAFPRPSFVWIINDDKIAEGNSDSHDRLHAESAKDLGKGNWNVTLRITQFMSEDSEKTYKLIATNQVGESTFNVVISTSLHHSVMELGAGTIIGIVAAILVLLLIIFLVVFARATGRWCFAGGVSSSRHDIRESSDTESADHGPTHKSNKPKINLNYIFSKKKDKVADEPTEVIKEIEQPPVTNPSEKSGRDVVYAELDLKDSSRMPRAQVRPEDEKTEYAEIVYTANHKDEEETK